MKAAARLLLILALMAPTFASAQTQTAPPPTCRLFATATIVNYNTKVRLDWSSHNAAGGYLTDVGSIPPSGSSYVVPGKNTTYAASFTGPGGTIVCRVAVAVRSGGAGTSYGGGVVNIDGTAFFQGSSIDTTGSPISPIGGVNTNGQSINSNNTINTTNNPIDTNKPVNLDRTVNLGGNVTLPTAPSVAPSTAAQNSGGLSGGIVPFECRNKSTIANCDLCSLAQLGQNLGNFLLGVTIPAAALLFAWAGILYFSSRGNPGQIEKAHKVFRSVVIGFVIAVSAWVLVNTVMNMLIQGGDIKSWNWRELNCAETRKARLYNMSLSTYLNSSLPGLQAYSGGGTGYECATGTLKGNTCVDSSNNVIGTPRAIVSAGTGLGCSQYGAGYAIAGTQCYDDMGQKIGPALRPGQLTDSQQDQLQDDCDNGEQASCAQLNSSLSGVTVSSANYTSQQNVWLSACRQGDVASCQSFSGSTGSGELGARISSAVQQYAGTNTSSGPDGGNKACAWAVNNILAESGIAPIDGNSVALMQQQLQNGRGDFVGTDRDLSNTRQGDIVIWKTSTMSHVGICEDDGCARVASNSSSNASFVNVTSASFNGRSSAKIYRVNN